MPEDPSDPRRPEKDEGRAGSEGTGRSPATAGQGADDSAEHDETGLDLARSIARGLAGTRGNPGRARRRDRRAGRKSRRVDPEASGAHPDDRDPQLLDTTIGRLIADQGWGTDVRVHGVFTRWEHLVGPEVAQHCAPESFSQEGTGAGGADSPAGGRLVVRTDSTAWATQMRLLAPTVLRRLNEELGHGTVTAIDVRGPTGPTWKRGLRSVRGGRGPRDTYG
jgi:predicted nucleic acid-binding Zn ribbon protein